MNIIKVVFDDIPVTHELEVGQDIKRGIKIVLETQRGLEIGKSVGFSSEKKPEVEKKEETFEEAIESQERETLSFVRIATAKDIETAKENEKFAETIKIETKKLVRKYELEMKVSGVRVTLDKNKAIISFTAENRVDFRELVKELANIFKIRIELRQIGSRDEARIMGGFGPCGKVCCCKEFLDDFEHVSIKMAKTQNLSLNPTKISGLCGRLMCCLEYENEHYAETARIMPKINSDVMTPNGVGRVMYNDLLKRIVQVKIGDENTSEIKAFDLSEIKQINR